MELEDLYQDIILDHARRPRNFGEMDDATTRAFGHNPSCGDEVMVYLKVDADGQLEDVSFTGQSCAICKASASIMTGLVKGTSREEALELRDEFHAMITQVDAKPDESLGNARVLKGVSQFPERVKCATLGWNALKQALTDQQDDPEQHPATTEE